MCESGGIDCRMWKTAKKDGVKSIKIEGQFPICGGHLEYDGT